MMDCLALLSAFLGIALILDPSFVIGQHTCAGLINRETLHIRNAETVPSCTFEMKNLRNLRIVNSKLREIPAKISNLVNLRVLDLSKNRIQTLSENLFMLPKLEHLNLNDNEIRELPESVYKLSNLTTLLLRSNQLTNMPKSMVSMQSLRQLEVQNNSFNYLPEIIPYMNLAILGCDFHIVEDWSALSTIAHLTLSGEMSHIPDSFSSLVNLSSLDLVDNETITEFPSALLKFRKLQVLNVDNTRLKSLPPELFNSANLEFLGFFSSQIMNLPEFGPNAASLKYLNIGQSKISSLPDSIKHARNLQSLYLENNNFTSFPSQISTLDKLESLQMRLNPFSNPMLLDSSDYEFLSKISSLSFPSHIQEANCQANTELMLIKDKDQSVLYSFCVFLKGYHTNTTLAPNNTSLVTPAPSSDAHSSTEHPITLKPGTTGITHPPEKPNKLPNPTVESAKPSVESEEIDEAPDADSPQLPQTPTAQDENSKSPLALMIGIATCILVIPAAAASMRFRKYRVDTQDRNSIVIQDSPRKLRETPFHAMEEVSSERDLMDSLIPPENFQVLHLIGAGANGEALLANYQGRKVVLKKQIYNSIRHSADFKKEIELLKTLRHPNILKYLGVTTVLSLNIPSLALVSDYMVNGDLRSVLDKYRRWIGSKENTTGAEWWRFGATASMSTNSTLTSMSDLDSPSNTIPSHQPSRHLDARFLRVAKTFHWTGLKCRIVQNILSGLMYLHESKPKIIHRDLKSLNILLNEYFEAKICDFGTSRVIGNSTMTAKGSNYWMAPEVVLGLRFNEKADMFSFGVVLSELITHRLPYRNLRDHNGGQFTPLTIAMKVANHGLRPDITQHGNQPPPPFIKEIFRRCMNADPDLRPSASEAFEMIVRKMKKPSP